MLIEHQAAQPKEYPFVFVIPKRYDYIQRLRRLGKWTVRQGKCPVSNFQYQFQKILAHYNTPQKLDQRLKWIYHLDRPKI